MKTDQIFIGNIKKCTKYEPHAVFCSSTYINGKRIVSDFFGGIESEDEIYKENAVLLKIKNGGYVDLERFNSILDYIRIYKDIDKDGYRLGGLMMSTTPLWVNCLFVDENSLKPYYDDKQQSSNISVHQLKKQVRKNNR